jgi:hypothetical protein
MLEPLYSGTGSKSGGTSAAMLEPLYSGTGSTSGGTSAAMLEPLYSGTGSKSGGGEVGGGLSPRSSGAWVKGEVGRMGFDMRIPN